MPSDGFPYADPSTPGNFAYQQDNLMQSVTATSAQAANTGHGHVRQRPDGVKARCGGPAICRECCQEMIWAKAEKQSNQPATVCIPSVWITPAPNTVAAVPGCICPPGANLQCQAANCPRKPAQSEVRAL